jgi:hypothetical protein
MIPELQVIVWNQGWQPIMILHAIQWCSCNELTHNKWIQVEHSCSDGKLRLIHDGSSTGTVVFNSAVLHHPPISTFQKSHIYIYANEETGIFVSSITCIWMELWTYSLYVASLDYQGPPLAMTARCERRVWCPPWNIRGAKLRYHTSELGGAGSSWVRAGHFFAPPGPHGHSKPAHITEESDGIWGLSPSKMTGSIRNPMWHSSRPLPIDWNPQKCWLYDGKLTHQSTWTSLNKLKWSQALQPEKYKITMNWWHSCYEILLASGK